MKNEKNTYWRWGIFPVVLTFILIAAIVLLTRAFFWIMDDIRISSFYMPFILIPLFILAGLAAFIISIRYFVKKRLELNNLWSFAFSVGSYCSIIAGIISIITDDLPDTDNLFFDLVIGLMCLIGWAVVFTVFAAIYIQLANLILLKKFKTMNNLSIEVLDDDMPKPQRKLRRPPPSRRR